MQAGYVLFVLQEKEGEAEGEGQVGLPEGKACWDQEQEEQGYCLELDATLVVIKQC